eukprot:5966614-Prorocentrum_lima.AAC.1
MDRLPPVRSRQCRSRRLRHLSSPVPLATLLRRASSGSPWPSPFGCGSSSPCAPPPSTLR